MKLPRIILLVVIFVVVVLFIGWNRMPQMVADHLAKKLQVSVEIKDITVRPGRISIEKLTIDNPPLYHQLPRAFSAEIIQIHAPLMHYFDQNLVIDEVVLDTIYLGLEFKNQGSKEGNWTQIIKNYKASTESGSTAEKNQKNSGKKVLIKKLILKNISVDLGYSNTGKVQHLSKIDYLEFTNVTSEGGIPSEQITRLIMQQMLNAIFSRENLENMIEGFFESPIQGVQNVLEPFKGLIP